MALGLVLYPTAPDVLAQATSGQIEKTPPPELRPLSMLKARPVPLLKPSAGTGGVFKDRIVVKFSEGTRVRAEPITLEVEAELTPALGQPGDPPAPPEVEFETEVQAGTASKPRGQPGPGTRRARRPTAKTRVAPGAGAGKGPRGDPLAVKDPVSSKDEGPPELPGRDETTDAEDDPRSRAEELTGGVAIPHRLVIEESKRTPRDEESLAVLGLSLPTVRAEIVTVREILKRPEVKLWAPLFSAGDDQLQRDRRIAEWKTGHEIADLANYYSIMLHEGEDGTALVDELNELGIVEIAYLAPIPELPDIDPPTPSFAPQQDYLGRAPDGIAAHYAWMHGGDASGIKIVDVESGWIQDHEDLKRPILDDGVAQWDSGNHGAAVLGVLVAKDDGSGVTGIAHGAEFGFSSSYRERSAFGFHWTEWNVAEALYAASGALEKGDVLVLEQHAQGPFVRDCDCASGGICDFLPPSMICVYDQCGYLPMEYWQAEFDAIRAITGRGILIVEAAGNGSENLDSGDYNRVFDRTYRDSGAILVGAGDSSTRKPLCFSNYGSRVDLQGWGENVVTLGYGDLAMVDCPAGNPAHPSCVITRNQWYTDTFSGTSSATPIVAGAVAVIQWVQKANNNPPLTGDEMVDLLSSTGTPQGSGGNIGPLPDLRSALIALDPPSPRYEYDVELADPSLKAGEPSGYTGEREREGQDDSRYAVERLLFGEQHDKPCYLKVESADVGDPGNDRKTDIYDVCDGSEGNLKYVPLLTTSHDTFLYGIQACTSKTGNYKRLKGVRVYRARIDEQGNLEKLLHEDQNFTRTNCGSWHTPVFCEDGWLATEVVVHYQLDGGDKTFTGLNIRCKEIQVTKTCVEHCNS